MIKIPVIISSNNYRSAYNRWAAIAVGVLAAVLILPAGDCRAGKPDPCIGQSEAVFTLDAENTEIRGLAWDESTPEEPRLLVLDGSGKVFAYTPREEQLELLRTHDLTKVVGEAKLADPRGLALATEDGKAVIYFADWDGSRSRLWRYPLDGDRACSVDLSLYMFRIGDREVLDLVRDGDALLISYDASGHVDQTARVQRGLLRVQWNGPFDENPSSVQHLPDAGTAPSRGLAVMRLDGVGYLWGTVGNDNIYCAELRTGRGLFFFDRPRSSEESPSCWGLAFGRDALWVSENVPGTDRVHRVNVTKNLDAPLEGPRVPRRLTMTITTTPEGDCPEAGAVYHYYSRPYAYEVLGNQGIWPETESIVDLSGAGNATIRQETHDPGGDASSRQTFQCVEYASAPARSYSSRYEIDVWTNPYKKFVYPHRVDADRTALAGTNYLADDPMLYNLNDTATYESFIERVRRHIEKKYGGRADMENPYWAARNVVEYIQDNYYYPHPERRKPATVDYDHGHYDANPGNLKIALSDRPYDKTQIIACSGTSVMVTGAMRHLGIPARWLGTGTPRDAVDWDRNGNGLLDPEESATCTNGHRYTQVWLGGHYGWICFDATPSKPAQNDYDVSPPLQPQWRYMMRAASGHRLPNRIVFNVGSEFIEPLYRDFEYDERLAIDNNCGGDQRYNLQGRFEKPALWKNAGHDICVKNPCFVTDVTVTPQGNDTQVTWKLEGAWDRIAEPTVSLTLQQNSGSKWNDVATLARSLPAGVGAATVVLPEKTGGSLRVIIRRDGDSETGGVSEPFEPAASNETADKDAGHTD